MNTVLEALPFEYEFESTTHRPPSRRATAAQGRTAKARASYPARAPYPPRTPGSGYATKKPTTMANNPNRPGYGKSSGSGNGSGSAMVRQVQHRLNQLLGLRLHLNGLLDVPSRSALRRFQSKVGLPASGMLDPQTRSKLAARGGTGNTGSTGSTGNTGRPQHARPAGTRHPHSAPPAFDYPDQAAPPPYASPYPLYPRQCQCGPASGPPANPWQQSPGQDQAPQTQWADQDQAQSADFGQGSDQDPGADQGSDQDQGHDQAGQADQGQEEFWF